ncbi:MAG: PAS domain S-box protein [Nitrospirae bacterium]|nr:PAS domain S-box protein [Nitrospirota bacterium]
MYNQYITAKIDSYSVYTKLLSENPLISRFCKHPVGVEAVNKYLSDYNDSIEANVTYIMDVDGLTMSSSNYKDPKSFVGSNYGFREYFRKAVAGQPDIYIAIGVTQTVIGYYTAYPVRDGKDIIGVVAIKYFLNIFHNTTIMHDGILLVSDNNNVIFDSNDARYRFHTIGQLPEETRQQIKENKQYASEPLPPLPLTISKKNDNLTIATIQWKDAKENKYQDVKYLLLETHDKENEWHIHMLVALSQVTGIAAHNALYAVLIVSIIFLAGVLLSRMALDLKNRREYEKTIMKFNEDLELKVDERTQQLNEKIGHALYIENVLKESENKYRQLVELSLNGIWAIDSNGITTFVNQAMADMLGYKVEEMIGRNLMDFMNDEGRAAAINAINKQKETGKKMQIENFFLHKSGNLVYVLISSVAIYDKDGNINGAIATMMDITERKSLEQTLLEREQKFRQLIELSREGIWVIDKDNITTYVNQAQADMLGYTVDEMAGRLFLDFIDDEAKEKAIKSVGERQRTGNSERLDTTLRHKNGNTVYVIVSASPLLDEQGNHAGSFGVISDITQRKEMEEKLRKSLSEQELLLRELHHRVKNNLQVISGLVGLQLSHIKDEGYRAILRDTQTRIQSIALVHERLYNTENLSDISMKEYIFSLVKELFVFFDIDKSKISIVFNVEDVNVAIEVAIPCGLIINELFTNILKYAFKDKDGGEVTLELKASEGGEIELIVADNGVGLPEGMDIDSTRSLGLKVVSILIKQLRGTIEIDRTAGTRFRLRFNKSGLH